MKQALSFGRLFLFSPSKAAEACERPDAWRHGLKIYAVLMPLQLASAWFNPLSFLDPNAPVGTAYGALFWLRVAMWQPVIFALSVFFLALTLEWLREGSLPVKAASTAAWAAVPLGISAYYAPQDSPPRLLFIFLLAAWLVPGILVARRVPAERWRKIATFMLGLCALQVVVLAAEYLTVVPARSYRGFVAFSLVSVVWLLAVASGGLRRLVGMPTPRVVLAFLLATIVILVVPALAFLLGLMPKEVLKVVIFV
jgi:hypothetical protein